MIRNIGPPAPNVGSVKLELAVGVRLEGSWIGPPAPNMDSVKTRARGRYEGSRFVGWAPSTEYG